MGKQCTVMVRSGWTSEAEGTIGSQGDREPLEGIIQKIGCGQKDDMSLSVLEEDHSQLGATEHVGGQLAGGKLF